MAHPSFSFPTEFYVIPESTTATDDFFAVTCSVAGTVTLKGGGRFEHVDVSELANDAAAAKFIDPGTGKPFASDDDAEAAGDGGYEKISSEGSAIALSAGQTLYGRFSSITTDSDAIVVAYKK